jgi:hypothetical protein
MSTHKQRLQCITEDWGVKDKKWGVSPPQESLRWNGVNLIKLFMSCLGDGWLQLDPKERHELWKDFVKELLKKDFVKWVKKHSQ